jgi:uncharacterized membrane protein
MVGLVQIAVFDIAGPIVLYSELHSHGWSAVTALVLSGAFPALGVLITMAVHRRLDAIGAVVLAGIVVSTLLGLSTGSAKLTLVDGAVSTGVLAVVFLASLWSSRPIMYRFALEFMGADTPKGRDFADRWRYPGFRRVFRVMTVVWGVAFLMEAVVTVVVVELSTTGFALTFNKIAPYAVAGALAAWMTLYGKLVQRRGERLAAASAATNPGQGAIS